MSESHAGDEVQRYHVHAPVHAAHCNRGEYIGCCKYGDVECPALAAVTATSPGGVQRYMADLPDDRHEVVLAWHYDNTLAENAMLRKALEAIAEIDSRSLLDPRHIAAKALRGAAGEVSGE